MSIAPRRNAAPIRMADIARRVGCSRAAVTHVLTGAGEGRIRVSAARAEIIRQVAAELDYQPNRAAQQLKGKRSYTFGVLSKSWDESFMLRTLYWLQHHAAERHCQLLTAQATTNDEVRLAVRQLRGRGIDGVLLFAQMSELYAPESLELLAPLPRVVALFGKVILPKASYVDIDEGAGIRQAVEHLHRQGRRRIALVLGGNCRSCQEREAAFHAAHAVSDRECSPHQVYRNAERWSWEHADNNDRIDQFVERLIVQQGCDAVIGLDDFRAAFILQGLARRGLRVPQDVAVIGYENDSIAHHLTPALSTINIPVREATATAIEMLDTAADGLVAGFGPLTLTPNLVVRGTG